MRAVVFHGPNNASVDAVERPEVGPGEVGIEVQVAGLCGTDLELFRGTMSYLRTGQSGYPLQPGHEWAGRVVEVGALVSEWQIGDRVTGDTFVGCDECDDCHSGKHWLCTRRTELGVLGARGGALSDFVVIPERALHRVPDGLDDDLGAMVEPASCALRGVRRGGVTSGDHVLVWGAGTLGLLAALFVVEAGARSTVVARTSEERRFVETFGLSSVAPDAVGHGTFDVVIEATGAGQVVQGLLEGVRSGGRVVLLGVPPLEHGLPVSELVSHDLTVYGVLGGSEYIDEVARLLLTIESSVHRLIGTRIELEDVPEVLASGLHRALGSAPKLHVRLNAPRRG